MYVMQKMFYNVTYFNGYLNNWNTTENINMHVSSMIIFFQSYPTIRALTLVTKCIFINKQGMFGYASAFNSDVSSWNTSKVTNMAVSNVSVSVTLSQRSILHENPMHGAIQLLNERFFGSFLLKYIVHS